MNFLYIQLGIISIIWLGMAVFYNDMDSVSQFIFYAVTSWLLFLIVMTVKAWIRQRKAMNKDDK